MMTTLENKYISYEMANKQRTFFGPFSQLNIYLAHKRWIYFYIVHKNFLNYSLTIMYDIADLGLCCKMNYILNFSICNLFFSVEDNI